ncbi:uncharacterized protein EDB91DRAFT_1121008 [Suillus paluster]|uniref:uncharacterized protein n=1 Tax=Suillus paluster TaxID=48578 RepID=UPI001B86F2AF|nr:uncharacterized protein EDB91DRAFT_1121008 [Suillus paluster]KAG1745454.1 hypothetical protein EDB91DRAFT_1121008 [Suillus paluster]
MPLHVFHSIKLLFNGPDIPSHPPKYHFSSQIPASSPPLLLQHFTHSHSLLKNPTNSICITYKWTEDFVIKYLWSTAAYGLIAVSLREMVRVGVRVAKDESKRMRIVSLLLGRKDCPSAAFSSHSQTQAGDLCMHIRTCKRLLD